MRLAFIGSAAVLLAGLAVSPASAAPAAVGDYAEARSCNIFIGACHAEGERPSEGRQAMMAWKIRKGEFDGVDLSGVRAVALVTADRNLGEAAAVRKSVIYVDAGATLEQRKAIEGLLKAKAAASLGTVVAVKATKIDFNPSGETYTVDAPGVATMKLKKQPGQLCCLQNYEVWYRPFVPMKDSKIGFSIVTRFSDKTLNASWSSSAQNNAYFGEFSF